MAHTMQVGPAVKLHFVLAGFYADVMEFVSFVVLYGGLLWVCILIKMGEGRGGEGEGKSSTWLCNFC